MHVLIILLIIVRTENIKPFLFGEEAERLELFVRLKLEGAAGLRINVETFISLRILVTPVELQIELVNGRKVVKLLE